MKPVRNNVLVKPMQSSSYTEGGLLVPDSVRKPSNKVLIVEVGTGTPKRRMTLKKGQVGFRVRDWGEPIEINGELHYIMDAQAIIATE